MALSHPSAHAPGRHRLDTARRTAFLFLLAAGLAIGALIGSARPVAACSCVAFESMKDYANADNAVFTGTAGVLAIRGVPVEVDQWLWGNGAAPVVWLSANSFGDGRAGCGTTPPTPGTSWIWVAWLPGGNGDFGTGLCSPHQRLDSPEGQAMLEEAIALFGVAEPPAGSTPEPTAAPAAPSDPTPAGGIPTIALVGAGVALATAGLFGGLIYVARRPRRIG
jgi:hypothetical protein